MSTPAIPRMWWEDKKTACIMFYAGNKIDFMAFPDMFSHMDEDLIHLWKEKILLGLDLLTYYDTLFDDLSNTTVGYSFLTHSKNQCFAKRDHLVYELLKNTNLSARFLTNLKDMDGNRM